VQRAPLIGRFIWNRGKRGKQPGCPDFRSNPNKTASFQTTVFSYQIALSEKMKSIAAGDFSSGHKPSDSPLIQKVERLATICFPVKILSAFP
jgi:hypothetical protein